MSTANVCGTTTFPVQKQRKVRRQAFEIGLVISRTKAVLQNCAVWCKKRGMRAAITPYWAGAEFGSQSELEKLVEKIWALKTRGDVS